MQKSKAITPEMSGIFERIEKQTEEYENAFNELNKFYRDLIRIQRENEELILKNQSLFEKNTELIERIEKVESFVENYIKLRLDKVVEDIIHHLEVNIIDDFKEKIDTVIEDFTHRAEQAIGMVEGSTGIVELLKKLRETSDTADKKVSDVDTKLKDVNKANDEILIIKEEFFDTRRQIKDLVEDTNKISSTLVKNMQAEFKNAINESNAKFKNAINESTQDAEEKLKNTVNKMKETQTNIIQRINHTEEKLEVFIGIANKLETHLKDFKKSGIDINRSLIEELKSKVEDMEANFKRVKKK
jgi:DNA repair exonuclease SbcCD ATPase subunit